MPQAGVRDTTRSRVIWIWLLVSAVGAGVCSLTWPAAHIGKSFAQVGLQQEYLPVGADSFYHARRILDTVADPASFYEFDPKIHAPEGSLLVWPWGYDYAMAWLVRATKWIGVPGPPIAILIWIPVVAVLVSIGLVMWLARELCLSLWSSAIAGLCVALSPLTQQLHGVGNIDHHFAEYILLLAAMAFGLRWLKVPENPLRAALLGCILGVAPAIHNALFILQLPLIATIALLWLQGIRLPERTVAYFAISLIASTIAVLIPSLPFRSGEFEFYELSWFHLYAACATSMAALLMTRLPQTSRHVGWLAGVAIAVLVPVVTQLVLAQSFLAGSIARLDGIVEMMSPIKLGGIFGLSFLSRTYSLLVWLLPLSAAYCVVQAWKDRASGRLLFWIHAGLGLTLLLVQARLHYFGSFALFLPLLVCAERMATRWQDRRRLLQLAMALALLIAYSPSVRHSLIDQDDLAGDQDFLALRLALVKLQQACAEKPGIVLADNDAGHYIRYYTNCSVIANNFLLTRQHEEKIRQIDYLTSLSAQTLRLVAPYVRYVLLRPVSISFNQEGRAVYSNFSQSRDLLFEDLMLKPPEEMASGYGCFTRSTGSSRMGTMTFHTFVCMPLRPLWTLDTID